MTTGDAAYWQARAETLERERDAARRFGRKWHLVALAAMSALRRIAGLLKKRAPALLPRYQEIIEATDGIATMESFLDSAIAVARLNMDRCDSIRPQTNGATEAYHRLETALLVAELAEVEETEYTARARRTHFRKPR